VIVRALIKKKENTLFGTLATNSVMSSTNKVMPSGEAGQAASGMNELELSIFLAKVENASKDIMFTKWGALEDEFDEGVKVFVSNVNKIEQNSEFSELSSRRFGWLENFLIQVLDCPENVSVVKPCTKTVDALKGEDTKLIANTFGCFWRQGRKTMTAKEMLDKWSDSYPCLKSLYKEVVWLEPTLIQWVHGMKITDRNRLIVRAMWIVFIGTIASLFFGFYFVPTISRKGKST